MSYFSGSDGRVFFGTQKAKARNWTLNATQQSIDTTTLEDTDRTLIAGLRSATGSCTILYYESAAGNQEDGGFSGIVKTLVKPRTDTAIDGIAAKPELVRFKFAIHDGSNPAEAEQNRGKWIEFDAYLTGATMSVAVGEILQADVNFDVVGAPRSVTLL